ncbi:MAG: lipoprotein [Methyloglobulus sp.]
MKDYSFTLVLLSLMLSACGQPGPLYLPTDKPPVYVEPDPETKDIEPKQATKPEPPPQPEIKQPTTEQ